MDPVITYEMWQEDLRTGTKTRGLETERGYSQPRILQQLAAAFNADELDVAENHTIPPRPVRTRYFVVKATTTFEELQ
jgi:hypothetical protein